MKAQTLTSKEEWKSPDGQRTIWEVAIKADDGKDYKLKTFSEKIAQVGFEGEVESYLNSRGDRFIKQVAQEGGYKGGRGGSKGNNQPVIQAQWAIGQARGFIRDRGEILPEKEYWLEVEKTAVKLIEVVNNILGGSESTNPKAWTQTSPSSGQTPTRDTKKTQETAVTNPARLKPGDPIWPSDDKVDDAAIEQYMTATLATTEEQ